MKTKYNLLKWALVIPAVLALNSCESDDPVREDTPEMITKITLTFTPAAGGAPVVATATDPDGDGVQDIVVDGSINLTTNTAYTLDIELINGLAEPGADAYDVTAEVREEADEHLFFFGWTNNLFQTPAGNGNIDNRADAVGYADEDNTGLPLGLKTTWTTGVAADGVIRIMLKHQPDLKSATSSSSDGESDLDIAFEVHVD